MQIGDRVMFDLKDQIPTIEEYLFCFKKGTIIGIQGIFVCVEFDTLIHNERAWWCKINQVTVIEKQNEKIYPIAKFCLDLNKGG